jgi:protein-S-isoprenylcysteine O-methyltransferase Ste14
VAILLGPAKLNGLRFFKPALREEQVVSGPFRWLKNPMYTGYFLVFLGLTLLKNSLYDLAIALKSLLLLNSIQARIENRGLGAGTQQRVN